MRSMITIADFNPIAVTTVAFRQWQPGKIVFSYFTYFTVYSVKHTLTWHPIALILKNPTHAVYVGKPLVLKNAVT